MSEHRLEAEQRLGRLLQRMITFGTWLMAPISIGLIVMLGLIMVKFIQELVHAVPAVLNTSESELILTALSLVDFALVGNLLMVVALAGYSGFIARIMDIPVPVHIARMGSFELTSIKLKLVGSIVAISSIRLLEIFIYPGHFQERTIIWQLAIQVVIVVSGLLLALMDHLTGGDHDEEAQH